MKILGIDASFKSLGMCLYDTATKQTHYYLITEHPTKKLQKYKSPYLTQYFYESASREDKTADMGHIRDIISIILDQEQPDRVYLESPALRMISSSASQLSGLNYIIRLLCLDHQIPCTVFSPTHIKKEMTDNHMAAKQEMISKWLDLDPIASLIDINKVDDLADAFAIAYIGSGVTNQWIL